MVKRAVERYNAPTPLKFKVWGKVILIIGTVLQVSLQSVHVPVWATITVALLTALGTALPEFAVLHETQLPQDNTTESPEQ